MTSEWVELAVLKNGAFEPECVRSGEILTFTIAKHHSISEVRCLVTLKRGNSFWVRETYGELASLLNIKLKSAPSDAGVLKDAVSSSSGERWRVGSHYGIHVYEGEAPVATAMNAEFAQQIVDDHNLRLDESNRPRMIPLEDNSVIGGGSSDGARSWVQNLTPPNGKKTLHEFPCRGYGGNDYTYCEDCGVEWAYARSYGPPRPPCKKFAPVAFAEWEQKYETGSKNS